jgi:hypothetical protein
MANQNEKLARALEALERVEQDGIVRSSDLGQTYRERLVKAGFLTELIKGWLFVTHPEAPHGSSVSWYGSFWAFVRQYLESRFGDGYCLSAEASIKRHVRSAVIPAQVSVIAQADVRQVVKLPFDTSLYVYSTAEALPPDSVKIDGVWAMDLPTALCRLAEPFYRTSPEDAELALRLIRDPSSLLHVLLGGSQGVVAGRLVGAYRFLGSERFAEQIKDTMEAAGSVVRVSNPFERAGPMLGGLTRVTSPHIARIQGLWAGMRADILLAFADRPPSVVCPADYLAEVEERYAADAYNSLSIEGYRVTPELIERVRAGGWNPDASEADGREGSALAARGYFQAFQAVKGSIVGILAGAPSAEVIERDFRGWFRQMFSPAVVAGVLQAGQLAGYRNSPVYLRGSRYVPPSSEAVADCMDAFFALLRAEEEPIVCAVLGHFIFVYIHPYSDGNGRIGRFLMNVALASGGYPWTVIRQEKRDDYLSALEAASTEHDIGPFARFVRGEMAV